MWWTNLGFLRDCHHEPTKSLPNLGMVLKNADDLGWFTRGFTTFMRTYRDYKWTWLIVDVCRCVYSSLGQYHQVNIVSPKIISDYIVIWLFFWFFGDVSGWITRHDVHWSYFHGQTMKGLVCLNMEYIPPVSREFEHMTSPDCLLYFATYTHVCIYISYIYIERERL